MQGNEGGDPATSFGHLDARVVPYYGLPQDFLDANPELVKPNALGAIVCGDRLFYAIYGDRECVFVPFFFFLNED